MTIIKRGVKAAALTALFICGIFPAGAAAEQLSVFVSVLPQKYLVERVAGDRARVGVMVGPGQSPATYEPSPRQMVMLADAGIYFRIGVPFEKAWMARIADAGEGMQIVDTAAGVTKRALEVHGHGGEREGEEGGKDPHIWTSPLLTGHVARTMMETFSAVDPAHRQEYREGYDRLAEDLLKLDGQIRERLAGVKNRKFMTYHPSWGYFADTYGLEQVVIERGGKEPGARQLAELIERAREEKVRVIFVQEQFSRRNAEAVAEAVGAKVVSVDPLSADYLANLKSVADRFAKAMQ